MSLSAFIENHVDEIVGEWTLFARTMLPSAKTMTDLALRDHGRVIPIPVPVAYRNAAKRKAASFLPRVRNAAIACRCRGRGRALPSSQL